MKYFTLQDWIESQALDGLPHDFSAVDAYDTYLKSIRESLPLAFRRMLDTICIHDAALRTMVVDLDRRRVSIELDAGDVTMREPRHVRLCYEEAERIVSVADPDQGLGGRFGYGELGNDEIEVLPDGGYEHRLLFSTGIELQIRFRDFRLEMLSDRTSGADE